MRTRNALVAALLTAVLVPGSGEAAPTREPQIVDARGDSIGGDPSADILEVLWTTTGRTKVVTKGGSKRRVYQPEKLVVRLTLAGLPGDAPLGYEVEATAEGCGRLRFTYSSGEVFNAWNATFIYECGTPDAAGIETDFVPDVQHQVGRTTVTWIYPIRDLPKPVKPGTLFSKFEAKVMVVEPAGGFDLTLITQTPPDRARGAEEWELGS